MQFDKLDIAVILVYFAGIAGMGLWFAKRNKNTEDYFLGGRNFSGWVIGLSMVGTGISSLTFMAYPGDAYKTAWLRLMGCFTLPIAAIIATVWILPFFRRTPTTSAYEYLEKRFGPRTRVYAAIVFLVGQVMRIGTVLYLLSLLIHEISGQRLPVEACILVGGAFVAFYTVAGGMEAVVWTDVVQTIVLLLGGLACLVFIVWKLPGGLGQIFEVAIADGKFIIADAAVDATVPFQGHDTEWGKILTFERQSWDVSFWHKTGTMMLLLGFNAWITEYCSNQNVVQRFCAAKSAKEAKKALWICCLSSVPIWTYFTFLGTAFYVYFKVFPDQAAYEILVGAEGKAAEQILPYFVLNALPVGVAGLVVAAVMAAAMSTLDSGINAISTVSIVDVYRRHIATQRDEKHYLRAARAVAIVASVFMLLFALWFHTLEKKTFQDTGIILAALVGGGLLGIYLLGFLTTWGDGRAILCGIILTTLYTMWMGGQEIGWIPREWPPSTDSYYTGFIANFIMFGVGFAASCLLPGPKRDLRNLTVWTQDKTPLI